MVTPSRTKHDESKQAITRAQGERELNPSQTHAAFEGHRERVTESSRWERLYPIHMGPGRESWSLTFTFAPELGDVTQLFPLALGGPYASDRHGVHAARDQKITLKHDSVALRIEGTKLPAWDGGVQDAILRTIASELLPSLVGAEMDRWTDTPFEDLPRRFTKSEARALVGRLIAHSGLVRVEWEMDYFSRAECANPDLEVHFHDPKQCHCTSARWHEANRFAWMPPGTYRATAAARVFSQPLARWTTENARANEILWVSPTLPVELRPSRVYRFAVGLAAERRELTEEERRFIQDPMARLASPRAALHLRLVSETSAA